MINSVFRTGKNYCPQVILEECKYVAIEKKMSKYIIKDIETKILTKKILMKKIRKIIVNLNKAGLFENS